MTTAKLTAKKSVPPAKPMRLKTERLSMRIDSSAKNKLERAAAYSRRSISDYVVSCALAAAEADIQAQENMALTPLVWDRFYEALKKPPKSNAALKALLKAHDQAVLSR